LSYWCFVALPQSCRDFAASMRALSSEDAVAGRSRCLAFSSVSGASDVIAWCACWPAFLEMSCQGQCFSQPFMAGHSAFSGRCAHCTMFLRRAFQKPNSFRRQQRPLMLVSSLSCGRTHARIVLFGRHLPRGLGIFLSGLLIADMHRAHNVSFSVLRSSP